MRKEDSEMLEDVQAGCFHLGRAGHEPNNGQKGGADRPGRLG